MGLSSHAGSVSTAKRGERHTVRGLLKAQCPGGGECARGRGRGEGPEGEHVAGERHGFLRSIDVLGSFGIGSYDPEKMRKGFEMDGIQEKYLLCGRGAAVFVLFGRLVVTTAEGQPVF